MRPPSFTVCVATSLSPATAWERLWDLSAHSRLIPFTRVGRVGAGGPKLQEMGDRFVARTQVGRWGFDDAMIVREWTPPRRAVIDKVGSPLRGRIEVSLAATAGGTVVRWRQTYGAVGVPQAAARLARPIVRAGYAVVLRRLLRAPYSDA